jgi:hypothetical protein
VSEQIASCLTAGSSRAVAVPRWAGLARLGELPPIGRTLDRVLSRNVDRIRSAAARAVDKRVD